MKEIRQIKNKVVSTEDADSNNAEYQEHLKRMLGIFDSEPGYYRQVIRPMLSAGHENELVYFLKELGIIKNEFTCPKSCYKLMSWTSAKVNDMYQWKCNNCMEKRSIREDSIFVNVKCSFKNGIRILLGWCKGNDITSMSQMLGIKPSVVSTLYKKAGSVALKYITYNLSEWTIGGPGKIILVDTYPEMCGANDGKPILCITEVKSFPQKYWLELLQPYRRSNAEQQQIVREHIVDSVKKIVLPGSVIIIPANSVLCVYEKFANLKHLYPLVITTDELSRHDDEHRTLASILDTIWYKIEQVCGEAQSLAADSCSQFLTSHMWRQKYEDNAFEMLVYQLVLD